MPKIVKLRVAPRGTYALWRDALFNIRNDPPPRTDGANNAKEE